MIEASDISIRSNWLLVKNQELRADVLKNSRRERRSVDSTELRTILLLGQTAILEGIESFYESTQVQNPNIAIGRPSIWTAQLGTTQQADGLNSRIITVGGYTNTNIYRSKEAVYPAFHPHWNAIADAGFVPEVRIAWGEKDRGAWLLLRRPEIVDVLHGWLDYKETGDAAQVREMIQSSQVAVQNRTSALNFYQSAQADYITASVAPSEVERQARQQIGLNLACAALKLCLHDDDGYAEEIEDVLDYADHTMDDGTIRALENATWHTF